VVGTVLERANHFCTQPMVVWAYDQVPRQLGAGGALTVLRFAPLARFRPVLGYNACLERVPGSWLEKCRL
jgi:hypothetical protein